MLQYSEVMNTASTNRYLTYPPLVLPFSVGGERGLVGFFLLFIMIVFVTDVLFVDLMLYIALSSFSPFLVLLLVDLY